MVGGRGLRSQHKRLLDSLSEPLGQQPALEIRQTEIAEIELRLEALASVAGLDAEAPAVSSAPRRKARVELSASVLVDHGGSADVLPLVNVSLTGALILAQGTVLGRLRIGSLLLLGLVAGDGAHRVDLLARIVRREGDATAVDWSQDQAAAYDVAQLLDALARADEAEDPQPDGPR